MSTSQKKSPPVALKSRRDFVATESSQPTLKHFVGMFEFTTNFMLKSTSKLLPNQRGNLLFVIRNGFSAKLNSLFSTGNAGFVNKLKVDKGNNE